MFLEQFILEILISFLLIEGVVIICFLYKALIKPIKEEVQEKQQLVHLEIEEAKQVLIPQVDIETRIETKVEERQVDNSLERLKALRRKQ